MPARLIWATNRENPAGVTLVGTGYSDPLDLSEVDTLFFSVVVGDPPEDMQPDHNTPMAAKLIVSLQVQDAGGTWLPVAFLHPYYRQVLLPEDQRETALPSSHVSVGLFLPAVGQNIQFPTVPMVLPPTARIRWDAHRPGPGPPRGRSSWQPASFGRTVISLFGR
ncbi:hypothetical protein ACIQM4_28100 [Streptomyces sp. NPDC091272]|uniref:hypothetical protein n=1 Tax=Streptomyces sp. NPDC091272 TaxID=3365981 RepID=UPI003824D187